jgi:protein SHQ1
MDYINNEEIKELMKFKSVYAKELKRIQKNAKAAQEKSKPIKGNMDFSVMSALLMMLG